MKRNQEQNTDSIKAPEEKQSIGRLFSTKKETINSIDAEDKIELERKEAYIEPKTRDLLRKLLQDGDKQEILPKYVPGIGFAYNINDQVANENEQTNLSREFLENLTRLDILQKSFYDSVSACPNCESTIVTMHNRCPKCKSHNINKTSLTEHIPCGFIDQKTNYKQNKCPKCGQPLLEGEYRNMGRWYVCQECGDRFEHPEYDLICRNCNKNFNMKDAQVIEVPKYSLNLNRKKELRQNVASLENIRSIVSDLDFTVEIPGLTIGQKSGMQHHFSMIARKRINNQEVVMALDHAVSESEVQASPLILYIYKTSEVKIDIPVFIAMPKLNEMAKKIAQGHDILLIEGSAETKEDVARIQIEIEERVNRIIDKIAADELAKQPPTETKTESASFFGKLIGKKQK